MRYPNLFTAFSARLYNPRTQIAPNKHSCQAHVPRLPFLPCGIILWTTVSGVPRGPAAHFQIFVCRWANLDQDVQEHRMLDYRTKTTYKTGGRKAFLHDEIIPFCFTNFTHGVVILTDITLRQHGLFSQHRSTEPAASCKHDQYLILVSYQSSQGQQENGLVAHTTTSLLHFFLTIHKMDYGVWRLGLI